MEEGNNIAVHVLKVENMACQLFDLAKIIPKFMCITNLYCATYFQVITLLHVHRTTY